MTKHSCKPVRLLTGKYGVLLLTVLHVCLACLILTLSNYWVAVLARSQNTDFMTFFLPDYRIGFVSRAFVGSVIYLFTDHPTVRMVTIVLWITIVISSVLLCRMQALLVKKTLLASDYATLLLSYLFFLNKLFWWNSVEGFGLLDIFMTLLVQLFLLGIEHKRTLGYWLSPIVCFIGLLIHTAFFFAYFPVVAAILWFDLLKSGKPSRGCAAAFAVTCAVSVALFAMFTVFPQHFVRVDSNEMLSMLKEKYDGDIMDTYFISHMYRTNGEKYADTIEASGFLEYAGVGTNIFSPKILQGVLVLVPLSGLFVFGCVTHMRRSGSRITAYLGFIAPLVTLVPSLHFSTDKERFFSLCILAQYMMLHYISTQSDVRFLPSYDDLPKKKLSAYAAQQRREKVRRLMRVCAAAVIVYSVAIALWR